MPVKNCGSYFVYKFDYWINYDCYGLCGNETGKCIPGICLNGGTCVDTINGFNCTCPMLYSGRRCEIYDAPVRLVGGQNAHEGRVEVFYNGQWGKVCDDSWDINDANVVCRQLGLPRATSATCCGRFGPGNGSYLLDDVMCSGSESALGQCRSSGWGNHNCARGTEEAGVVCETQDPCANYTELSSSSLSKYYYNPSSYSCVNQNLTVGWYRFTGDAGTAMATSCVSQYYCGGPYTSHMSGSHPSVPGTTYNNRLCISRYGSCCYSSYTMPVKNCGSYFVYKFDSWISNYCYGLCGNGTGICTPGICLNGGTCVDTINGPNCTCPRWYSGHNCEIQDPCGNYTELSSPSLSRYYYSPTSYSCVNRGVGWYRFTGAAGTTMATSCVSQYHCGGQYTAHMSGSHPSVPGTTWYNSICISLYGSCCYRSYTMPVKNCGSYFVYKFDNWINYYCHGFCGNGTGEYYCVSRPCQNGGTCHGTSSGYTCTCPFGYTGNQCQTREKGNVTCDPKYMEVEIPRSLYPNIYVGNFHLNDPNCRATAITSNTIRIRTGLKLCGTNFTEYGDTLEFENMLKIDSRYPNPGQSVITRQSSTVMRFYCRYSRSQLVSTSFSPAREIVPVSEGGFGNFTFTMFMYKTADYNVKYQSFEYPVQVSLNEPLWIMFQVVNATDLLVVFAETCFATPSASPNSYPKYVFLTNGCINDSTMAYSYNPLSSYQKFTIRSFRFIQDSSKLIYIHCKLMVCHRFSSNSRCSRGCINSGRKRREVSAFEDTSSSKELFTGPISIKNTQNSNGNQGSQHNLGTGLTIGVSVVGALLVAVCAIVIAKIVTTKWLKPNKVSPATARNIYAFDGPAELQFGDMNKPSDGPAELQFGDMNKPSDGPAALQLGDMDKPSELNI